MDTDLKTLEAVADDTCDIEREDEGRVVCETKLGGKSTYSESRLM